MKKILLLLTLVSILLFGCGKNTVSESINTANPVKTESVTESVTESSTADAAIGSKDKVMQAINNGSKTAWKGQDGYSEVKSGMISQLGISTDGKSFTVTIANIVNDVVCFSEFPISEDEYHKLKPKMEYTIKE